MMNTISTVNAEADAAAQRIGTFPDASVHGRLYRRDAGGYAAWALQLVSRTSIPPAPFTDV